MWICDSFLTHRDICLHPDKSQMNSPGCTLHPAAHVPPCTAGSHCAEDLCRHCSSSRTLQRGKDPGEQECEQSVSVQKQNVSTNVRRINPLAPELQRLCSLGVQVLKGKRNCNEYYMRYFIYFTNEHVSWHIWCHGFVRPLKTHVHKFKWLKSRIQSRQKKSQYWRCLHSWNSLILPVLPVYWPENRWNISRPSHCVL